MKTPKAVWHLIKHGAKKAGEGLAKVDEFVAEQCEKACEPKPKTEKKEEKKDETPSGE